MNPRRVLSVAVALLLALLSSGCNAATAERDKAIARIDEPAFLSVRPLVAASAAVSTPRLTLVLTVTAYAPPNRGTVVAVVRLVGSDGTAAREIHRFGMSLPKQGFAARTPAEAESVIVPLPEGAIPSGKSWKIAVELLAEGDEGDGSGASMTFGEPELRPH